MAWIVFETNSPLIAHVRTMKNSLNVYQLLWIMEILSLVQTSRELFYSANFHFSVFMF